MTPERRRAMGEAAVAAAKAIGYVGAGTVEFIAEQDGSVLLHGDEHAAAGRASGHRDDHRRRSRRVAVARRRRASRCRCGRTSSRFDGHAIEARIYAEDPERGFLPSIGTLAHLRAPAAGGRRARRYGCARRRRDLAVLRPDDRQADRPRRGPRDGAAAPRRRAGAVRDRGRCDQRRVPAAGDRARRFRRREARHRTDRAASRRAVSAAFAAVGVDRCWPRRWPRRWRSSHGPTPRRARPAIRIRRGTRSTRGGRTARITR